MRWTKNETVISEEFDGGALLVDTKSGARWRLNAAASAAWRLCDGTKTLADLTVALRCSSSSVVEFCQQFAGMGLLTSSAGAVLMRESSQPSPFSFTPLGLGNGPRRRPNPRGVSGPG